MRYSIVIPLLVVGMILGCEGPMGPPGPGFGSLDDPSVMPAVVYTYPPMNSTGPYPDFYVTDCDYGLCSFYSLIQIRFNKFMDVTSVRRALRIHSYAGDVRTDTSNVISVGGDVVLVTPVDASGSTTGVRYRVGETYYLIVDSTARDVNGNPLRGGFATSFTPEPFFRVVEMNPADRSVEVNTGITAGLVFNSRIDTSIYRHILIEPPVNTRLGLHYDRRSLYIFVLDQWMNSTTYTVTVNADAEDAEGNTMASAFVGRFTTVDFGISTIEPRDGRRSVPLNEKVYIYSTGPIDSGSFRSAFSIEPSTPGMFSFSQQYRYVSFEPAGGWLDRTEYTIRIDSTLRSRTGDRLPELVQSVFTTGPFRVTDSYPDSGQRYVTRLPQIRVYTNGPLETASVAGSVTIEPPVPVTIELGTGGSFFSVWPDAQLSQGTTYTVTIDTTLRTPRDVRLSLPYVFTFTTLPYE